MAAPDPRSDISQLTFGVLDDWHLDFLRRGLPGQDIWLLDLRRLDIWRLEIWRPRQMAAKTIGGRDNPCPGRLAS